MAQVAALHVHPVKALDPVGVESAQIRTNGGLAWDRRYAILDAEGEYVNGKREQRIHRIRSAFDLEARTVTLREQGESDSERFHLDDDREALAAWIGDVVGYPVEVVRADEGGFPDDTTNAGPTVIASATVEAVASWFDDISPTEMRRRLRPNIVIGGVEAFWEDRCYADPGTVRPVEIGDVTVHGASPCQRCVVPLRDPDTGAETPGFREQFVERRQETLPEWAAEAWFDHYFRLMVNTRIPESEWGETLSVGDQVADPGEPVEAQ
jgi:uncharacterized protein YcbX